MGVSGDYSLEPTEAFKSMFGDISQALEGDTVVKTVDIMIKFQTRQSGALWGEAVSDKTVHVSRAYPITRSIVPNDKELFSSMTKAYQKQSDENLVSKLGIESVKEGIELIYAVELDKYPTLLASLCQVVREMKDEQLFRLIQDYQNLVTSTLPDESPEKKQAQELAELPITSATAQTLLFMVRQKLNASSSVELYREARSYLLHAKPFLIENVEKEIKEKQELEETLRLPLESEKVQKLIAPLRDKYLNKQQAAEIDKVITCYKKAVWQMEEARGEKQLSSVDVKVVYAKRSNLDQELVYEKRYPSAS